MSAESTPRPRPWTNPEPHCGGRECGVARGHYDAACDCPCAVCAQQRDALAEELQ